MASPDNIKLSTDSALDPTDNGVIEREMGSSAAASPGRLVAVPGMEPGEDTRTKADLRAERHPLTGRAAILARELGGLTPSQLAWRKLKKNKLAVASLWVLAILYLGAIFAQFISPYDYSTQDPLASFRPPMPIHWTPRPTAYVETQHFDVYHDKIYSEDKSKPIPLYFFAHGSSYKFWDLIPTDLHLFGAANGQRVYVLGTDQFGRDYLSRILYASQISLSVGIIGISLTLILGILVGAASGYFGGIADDLIMRACEIVMSVPSLYLLLALSAALPTTLSPLAVYLLIILILSLVGFASMARIIRGMVLSVREREYVEAARALGVPTFKIIIRHVVPSTFTFAIVAATLSIPGFILAEAALSFLGLGIRDPMASWGNMLSAAQNLTAIEDRLWLLIPGLMIFITTLAFNFFGDGLRDALDPKSK